MFGGELPELFLFGRQLGLALAGAAALWGFVFCRFTRHRPREKECLVYDWIGERLLVPLAGGIAMVLLSLFVVSFFLPVYAHEGISLPLNHDVAAERNAAAGPFLFFWLGAFLLGLFLKKFSPAFFSRNMEWWYAAHFGFAFFLMGFFVWEGKWSSEQLFALGHSVHSIFTLGTVLVLDFLFLLSRSSAILKQHIYPLFPTLSKVILVGLGIDFLSVALVFPEALALTPKFFFMQTLVVVLIVNGALLAGPVSRRLMASVQQEDKAMRPSWEAIAGIAGVVSVASWGANTLVDFFENITLSYLEFLGLYLLFILFLYLVHTILERLKRQIPAFLEHPFPS